MSRFPHTELNEALDRLRARRGTAPVVPSDSGASGPDLEHDQSPPLVQPQSENKS